MITGGLDDAASVITGGLDDAASVITGGLDDAASVITGGLDDAAIAYNYILQVTVRLSIVFKYNFYSVVYNKTKIYFPKIYLTVEFSLLT